MNIEGWRPSQEIEIRTIPEEEPQTPWEDMYQDDLYYEDHQKEIDEALTKNQEYDKNGIEVDLGPRCLYDPSGWYTRDCTDWEEYKESVFYLWTWGRYLVWRYVYFW